MLHPEMLRSGILRSSLPVVSLVNRVTIADTDGSGAQNPGAPGLGHATRHGLRRKWRSGAPHHAQGPAAPGPPSAAAIWSGGSGPAKAPQLRGVTPPGAFAMRTSSPAALST